jgi:hypothetical protein
MKKSAVGFVLDEDERRRNKKSEEVMKNIERARQRREEEENRYRRPPSEEYYRSDERPAGRASSGGRRYEEAASKENKAPPHHGDRGRDWNYDDRSRQRPSRNMEDNRRGDNRFDERHDRGGGGDRYEAGRRDGYFAPRFERHEREERGRREDFRRDDQPPFEPVEYNNKSAVGGGHHGYQSVRPGGRDSGGSGRGFDERGGGGRSGGHWEEETTFEDVGRTEEKR